MLFAYCGPIRTAKADCNTQGLFSPIHFDGTGYVTHTIVLKETRLKHSTTQLFLHWFRGSRDKDGRSIRASINCWPVRFCGRRNLFLGRTFATLSVLALFGCSSGQETVELDETTTAKQIVIEPQNVEEPAPGFSTSNNLVAKSALGKLAHELATESKLRSPALQEQKSARAELSALSFERYPKITPVASTFVTSQRDNAIGISVEQVVWDGGRLKGRLSDAELAVAEASARAWQERNEYVFEGLQSYVDVSLNRTKLEILHDLKTQLEKLSDLVSRRVRGGVADRGELLRVSIAERKLSREIIAIESSLHRAEASLLRMLPTGMKIETDTSIDRLIPQCGRNWKEELSPNDRIAQIAVDRAIASEHVTRARRFPQLTLRAGSTYAGGEVTDPAVGFQLDARDMLGFGRRGSIDAAIATTQSARARYRFQRDRTNAELEDLRVSYEGYQHNLKQLTSLEDANQSTLKLYSQQILVGSLPLTDGISLFRAKADTLLDISDTQARMVSNCLRVSVLLGTLAELED